ncbi:MAG: ABC transporter substrate-binding protein [Bryobacteraceae bacterium]
MISRRLFLGAAASLASAAERIENAGGVLRMAIHSDPKTLDPLEVSEEVGQLVRYLTAGALWRSNRRKLRVEPELAASWKVLDGGRKAVIELRPGVKFSDGSPLEVEDVAATFARVFDAKRVAPVGEVLAGMAGSVRATASGKHSLTLAFANPVPGIERVLDGFPVVSRDRANRAVLGAFVIDDAKPGSHVRLRRNAHYFRRDASGRALPYLDGIQLDISQSRDLELVRFGRGELHAITQVSPDAFERLKRDNPAAARDAGPSFDWEMLWFNQAAQSPIAPYRKEWFASREFRRALSDAVNRADMARLVYRGYATAAATSISPANKAWANAKLRPHAYDPKAALARLTAAGFRYDGSALRDKAGRAVEFSVVTPASSKTRPRIAALIQQDLAKIGIKLNVVTLDFPSLIERISRTFDYDSCLLGLTNVDPDFDNQANVWLSSASQHGWAPNQTKPATEWEGEVDRLVRAQAATGDMAKRKAAVDRIQEIAQEQSPALFLLHPNALCAVSPGVSNADPVPFQPRVLWNAEQLRVS